MAISCTLQSQPLTGISPLKTASHATFKRQNTQYITIYYIFTPLPIDKHGKRVYSIRFPKLLHMGFAAVGHSPAMPLSAAQTVAIIMGSVSDWETMRHAAETLKSLNIPHSTHVVSAHRTPDRLVAFAKGAKDAGVKVIIAGAGGAAHLPGMTASMTSLPVLGVPVESKHLQGMDSLLSIVQMPGGIPVGTLAIGKAGAINAALLAASILGLNDTNIASALDDWRNRQTSSVALQPE